MSFGISTPQTQTSNLDEIVKQLFSQTTNQTGSSTGSSTQSGSTTGSTTGAVANESSRVLSPEQAALQPQLFKIISALSTNPSQFFAPAQHQAREQVNENYAGMADSLRQNFLTGGGGGGSGKFGRALLSGDLARRGDLSRVDNEFAVQTAQAPITAAQLAQNFLGLNFGEKSSGTTNATSTGTTLGTVNTRDDSSATVATTGENVTDRQAAQRNKRGWGVNIGI